MKAVANLVVVAVTALIFSCSVESVDRAPNLLTRNSEQEVGLVNNRLVFQNLPHLFQVMSSQERLNDVYQNDKIRTGFISFHKKNILPESEKVLNEFQKDLSSAGLPQLYYEVLNDNGEVQIGDTLVWYYKGKIHFIPNLDEERLSQVKQNPDASKLVGTYTVKSMLPEHNKNARVTIANGGIARPTFDFYQQSPVFGLRRYVHELKAVTQSGVHSELCQRG